MSVQSRFAGMRDAQVFEGGTYPLPGDYVVRIGRVKAGRTRKNVDNFIAEMTVVESNHPLRKVGSEMSWYVGLDKDAALGNIKGFIAVALSHALGEPVKLDEIDESTAEMVVGPDQPLKGAVLHLVAYNKPTREGQPFTRVRWKPYVGDGPEKTVIGPVMSDEEARLRAREGMDDESDAAEFPPRAAGVRR